MAQDQENDLIAIAWPGFVDILSACIIMFVFFLMVVATALFFHILIFVSKVESDVIVEEVQSEYEYEFSQVQTEFAESIDQNVEYDKENNRFIVFFSDDAISLLPEVKTQLEQSIKEMIQGKSDYTITIQASKFESKLDVVSRKISLARMLNARNTLVSMELPSSKVIPRMVPGYVIGESDHWVIIEIKETE